MLSFERRCGSRRVVWKVAQPCAASSEGMRLNGGSICGPILGIETPFPSLFHRRSRCLLLTREPAGGFERWYNKNIDSPDKSATRNGGDRRMVRTASLAYKARALALILFPLLLAFL